MPRRTDRRRRNSCQVEIPIVRQRDHSRRAAAAGVGVPGLWRGGPALACPGRQPSEKKRASVSAKARLLGWPSSPLSPSPGPWRRMPWVHTRAQSAGRQEKSDRRRALHARDTWALSSLGPMTFRARCPIFTVGSLAVASGVPLAESLMESRLVLFVVIRILNGPGAARRHHGSRRA